jgi:phosphoglycerate dehydrogenase-like enzyme
MHVIGVSNAVDAAAHCDEIVPRRQLAAVAGRSDFLVLVAPYSPATHHLIDERVLQAMKPGSFLLNIARGPVVDEQALVAALRAGGIGGAALDVFDREPLDPASALWSLPNVIITPHVGGFSDCYAQQLMPLVVDNLHAWISGAAPLRNLVGR